MALDWCCYHCSLILLKMYLKLLHWTIGVKIAWFLLSQLCSVLSLHVASWESLALIWHLYIVHWFANCACRMIVTVKVDTRVVNCSVVKALLTLPIVRNHCKHLLEEYFIRIMQIDMVQLYCIEMFMFEKSISVYIRYYMYYKHRLNNNIYGSKCFLFFLQVVILK